MLEEPEPFIARLLKYSIIVLLIAYSLPRVHQYIDEQIDGQWTTKTPLKYLNHPHPDFFLTGEEIISRYGYNVERHHVTTDDGYINLMFRLNKFTADQMNNSQPKPAVMLIHGHLDSSDTWIINENKSIAFMLAEAGYDVYMANCRGNKYSMGHATLDPAYSKEYWQNAIADNMALYDVPAFIERMKEISHVTTVSVVAHSQGCRIMLWNLERNVTYYKKNVNHVTLLSPFSEMHRSTWLNEAIQQSSIFYDDYLSDLTGNYPSYRNPSWFTITMKWVCGYISIWCDTQALFMVHSTDEYNDVSKQQIFFGKYPGQCSFKSWQYIKQLINSQKANLYDYGETENIKRYGQPQPPIMNVTKSAQAGVHLSMYAMKHDLMLPLVEQRKIKDLLGDSVEYTELNGGHMTYMVAKDMSYVHTKIIPTLNKYNPVNQP